MNKIITLLVFLMLFSCTSYKTITKLSDEIEISELNGKVKKVTSNIYYPAQTEPTHFIKKDDIIDITKKTYNGQGLFSQHDDTVMFFKEPNFEIEYDKKGRTTMLKYNILNDSLVVTKDYKYDNNKVVINKYVNKLGISTINSSIFKNGNKVKKEGKVYSVKDKSYQIGKTIFVIDDNNVKSILNLNLDNDTISNTTYKYTNNGKLLSIKTDSQDKSMHKQKNYEYLFDDEKINHSTLSIEDNNQTIIKEEITFDKTNLVQKGNMNIYDKAKRIDYKISLEYTYKNYPNKEKSLYHIKQTDSLGTLFVNETLTTYSQDELVKEIKTTHSSKGKTHFTFQYEYDKSKNWTAKYFFDVIKGGIIKLELRQIDYY